MAKARTRARCASCGHEEAGWPERCPRYGQWGTMVAEQVAAPPGGERAPRAPRTPARAIAAVPADERRASGIGELDRVLGAARGGRRDVSYRPDVVP